MNHTDSGPPPQSVTDAHPRLAEVVEDYRALLKSGNPFDRAAFRADHAELGPALAECLDALDYLDGAGLALRSDEAMSTSAGAEFISGLQRTLGDFRLLREVGRGGMGIVYEAEQISLGRRVALKVLPFAATMDPRQLQRFHNEARAAAGLHHTNIVPVYAVGVERGVHYYAMQLIEGQTLADTIADLRQRGGEAPLPEAQPTAPHIPQAPAADTAERAAASTERARPDPDYFRRVAEWGIQAAEALDHAHQLGIVHRDIKPANLLLDGRGSLWVTDFGLAQFQSDARLTMTGDLVGTLRYMSPEQALAKRVVIDHRTDVYSLGATLYELLTLRPAYTGNDRQELLRQIAFEEPSRLRRLNKTIPAELETIVLKAMEKNPADRYAAVKELADDMRRWQENLPIRARRPTLGQWVIKWSRRHQALVTAGAIVLGVALVALATILGLIWRQSRQLEAALASETTARGAEAENRQRAEDRFRTSSEAIEHLYDRVVSEQELLDQPPMQRLRRDALLEVLRYYERFLQEKGNDPSVRYAVAHSYRRVADIQRDLSEMIGDPHASPEDFRRKKLQDAEEAYREAVNRQEALLDDFPKESKYRAELATTYMNLGILRNVQARFEDAEKLFEKSVGLGEQLVADSPREAACRQDLIYRCGYLANSRQRETNKRQEAEALYRRALELSEGLVADFPLVSGYRRDLVASHAFLRQFYETFGPPERADAEWRRERALLEEMVAGLPGESEQTFSLGNLLLNRGDRLIGKGQQAEAEELYRQALTLMEKLAADKTLEPYMRASGPHAHNQFGDLCRKSGRTHEAELAYRKARSLSEALLAGSPNAPHYKDAWVKSESNLANLLAADGRRAEAIQSYRGIVATLERMAIQAQAESRYGNDLMNARLRLIDLLVFVGDYAGAVEEQRLCLRVAEDRANKSPALHNLQGLGQARLKLAELLYSAGFGVEADRTQRQALGVIEKSLSDPVYSKPHLWILRTGDLFFLAKAYGALGEKEKAREWFDKAVRWSNEHDPQVEEVRRFRAEAAAALEIKDGAAADKEASPPKDK